jgi:hypothetical protein
VAQARARTEPALQQQSGDTHETLVNVRNRRRTCCMIGSTSQFPTNSVSDNFLTEIRTLSPSARRVRSTEEVDQQLWTNEVLVRGLYHRFRCSEIVELSVESLMCNVFRASEIGNNISAAATVVLVVAVQIEVIETPRL